ncbi:MAG: carbohydrate deacetylase [Myxococcaceae bacterium]
MRTLIVNADDFGYDPAVTRGIVQSMRDGIVSSTTMMVNTPFSEDAAAQAHGLSIGLHLNLARHRPLWRAFPAELLVNGELSEPRASELPADVVTHEALAQLDALERLVGRPATHVDVHKHLHRNPNVMAGLIEAAKVRELPVRSINAAMRKTLVDAGVRTNPAFIGDAGATAYWTLEQLRTDLAALGDGVTELMCHPGYRPSHTKSGYAAQREVELATFTHPDARSLVEQLHIQLADFSVLAR